MKDRDTYDFMKYNFETKTMERNLTCPAENTIVNARVVLIYPSEYAYATDQLYWNREVKDFKYDSYNNTSKVYEGTNNLLINHNWMYLGAAEWTILPHKVNNLGIVMINASGEILNTATVAHYVNRPTFSLLSSITYEGGTGSLADPIRIA